MIVEWVDVTAPAGWLVWPGSMLPKIDPDELEGDFIDFLTEDMAQLVSPDGYFTVDVGWLPEGNPSGAYICVIVRDQKWDRPLVKIRTRSYEDVLKWVQKAIETINDGVLPK